MGGNCTTAKSFLTRSPYNLVPGHIYKFRARVRKVHVQRSRGREGKRAELPELLKLQECHPGENEVSEKGFANACIKRLKTFMNSYEMFFEAYESVNVDACGVYREFCYRNVCKTF